MASQPIPQPHDLPTEKASSKQGIRPSEAVVAARRRFFSFAFAARAIKPPNWLDALFLLMVVIAVIGLVSEWIQR